MAGSDCAYSVIDLKDVVVGRDHSKGVGCDECRE